MEQFSLEKYLENPNRKIVTRDGRSARIICTDGSNKPYPIFALIQNGEYKDVLSYTKDGINVEESESPFDLFFAPEKKSAWINLYKMNSIINPGPRAYDTKEEAESAAGDKSYYIATIKIEWEEQL